MMEEKKTRRWKVWFWAAAGLFIGVPILTALILPIVFAVNAIPKEKIEPPKSTMRIRPIAPRVKITTPAEPSYQDWNENTTKTLQYLSSLQQQLIQLASSRTTDSTAIELFEKWRPWLNNKMRSEFWEHFSNYQKKIEWRIGQPLNEDQTKYLNEHRELFQDLVKIAAGGGFPSIRCQEAAAMDPEDVGKFMNVYMFWRYNLSSLMAAESRRRQDAGDIEGAAEIIVAMRRLGRSTSEPGYWDYASNAVSFGESGYGALEDLLGRSMRPELAAETRDKLAAITPPDMHDLLEISYRGQRAWLVKLLTGPVDDLFVYRMNIDAYPYGNGWDFKVLRARIARDPFDIFDTLGRCATPAFNAVTMKSSAESLLRKYDESYERVCRQLDHPESAKEPEKQKRSSTSILFQPGLERATMDEARTNLGLAGLDVVAGEKTVTERRDPFSSGALKTIENENEIVIYSVGPDKKDQRGMMQYKYDPTNGMNSIGDMIIRIPRGTDKATEGAR